MTSVSGNTTGDGGNGVAKYGTGGIGGDGGGIYNDGDLTLIGCSVSGNTTGDGGASGSGNGYWPSRGGIGGGICNGGGSLIVQNSTVSDNHTGSSGGWLTIGGGIYNDSLGSLTIANSTITGNSAFDGGGVGGGGTIENSTITGNSALNGGGIYGGDLYGNGDSNLTLTNAIVAGNSRSFGSDIGIGGSFISSSVQNSLTNGAPLLAPLGDYGGPTQTMPPLPGSPAIDAGLDTGSLPATDQRGLARLVGSAVDIGAVEVQGVSDTESVLGSAWLTDNDGDGNAFGVEFALGTDWQTADATNPANLAIMPTNGFPAVTFGVNPAATNYTQWVIYRSLDLTVSNNLVEIYCYDGPTGLGYATNGVPVSATISSNSMEVIDDSDPLPVAAFYKIGVKQVSP